MDLRKIAQDLGGEMVGHQACCPGPGHSRRDRSLAIRLSETSPDGFIVHSFAGDDWRDCRDYAREKLGLGRRTAARQEPARPIRAINDNRQKLLKARHLWSCRHPIEGTPAERYLREARGYQGPFPGTLAYLPQGIYPHHSLIAGFGIPDEPEPGALVIADAAVRGVHLTALN